MMSVRANSPSRSTRRRFLAGVAAAACAPVLLTTQRATATPDAMKAAIKAVTGNATVAAGRVKLDLPALVENGNTVPLTVSVESPMTAESHVKAIHILTEKNPQPNAVSFHLGPRAGSATIATRIRLADTQQVVAIAQMRDGSFHSDSMDVIVTLSACLEDG